ncbi:hypothetical protein CEXT_770161 [Caerostris extrusa]|uniref:Uncharacterized protein n=1 Tax=Caerostris extrusa TaxID=172846 RepID=A0AAV4P9T9_CAEEX|nr:hypothetical protein CEXT_770161 [Caerostris extrusa]
MRVIVEPLMEPIVCVTNSRSFMVLYKSGITPEAHLILGLRELKRRGNRSRRIESRKKEATKAMDSRILE